MFSKNNLRHILILALGFFCCSYIYLKGSMIIRDCTSIEFAHKVSVFYGSFAMALGLLLFSLIYKKSKNIRRYYILFIIFSMISSITLFTTNNAIIMSTCLCLFCMFGTSGFGAGYHFSLVSSNVIEDYQGRVFAIGYAFGSLLTYIFSILVLPKSLYYLLIIIPIIIINTYLVLNCEQLKKIEKEEYTKSLKTYFITLSFIIIAMSALSAISQVLISFYSFNSSNNWFVDSRIYYSLGLICSGLLYDKKREIFNVCVPISFIFSLISMVLLNQNISSSIISCLAYLFISFFSIFRALVFINLGSKKKNMIVFSGFGLIYERIMEGSIAIFQSKLLENYLLLILLSSILLGLILWVYLLFYLMNNRKDDDKIKVLALKNGLSGQEEKVLYLIIQDLTNQEMADKLYLSVNTVRNHVANIYKKTGMNKKEIKEKCFFGIK